MSIRAEKAVEYKKSYNSAQAPVSRCTIFNIEILTSEK